MKTHVDTGVGKPIADSQLLGLYRSLVGPRHLPGGGRVSTKALLTSEAERQEQGQRLSLLIEREKQAGKPTLTDQDLQRLYRALR
jgi:hypothetical protein